MPILRILAGAAVVLLLLSTWPQLLGLQQFPFLAQLTALRGLMVGAALAGLVLFSIVAGRSAAWRRYSVLLMVGLSVVVVANLTLLSFRGMDTRESLYWQPDELTVFMWNMYRDGPEPQLVADNALEHEADVISLLETSPAAAEEIRRVMAEAGHDMQVFSATIDEVTPSRSTVLLISTELGEYQVDFSAGSTPRVPAVVARPVEEGGPTLVAAHAAPPVPLMMRNWSDGLEWIAERCSERNVIVAGDFNATLDHFAALREPGADVGSCRDAGKQFGSAGVGTWPSQLPTWLASPIDHIVAGPAWEFTGFTVKVELDGQGSDHRALLATLRRVD